MGSVETAASIVTLIEITMKTIKYLNKVKDASEDRSRLRQETSNILPLFISLQGKVEAAKNHQSVEWLHHVRGLAVENGPLDQLRSALEHLAKRLKPKNGLKGVAHAFVWTLHKDESEALLARIERVKTTINLALQGDILYVGRCTLSIHYASSHDQDFSAISQSQIGARLSDNS